MYEKFTTSSKGTISHQTLLTHMIIRVEKFNSCITASAYSFNKRAKLNGCFGIIDNLTLNKLRKSALSCHWCNKQFENNGVTLDHIWPLAGGGPNVIENLVPACKSCNSKKNKKNPIHYLKEINQYSKKREAYYLNILNNHGLNIKNIEDQLSKITINVQFNYKAGVCIFAVRTYSEYMSALYSLKRSCLFGELFFAARTGHRGLITYSYEQAEALIEYLKIHHRPIIYDDFGQ